MLFSQLDLILLTIQIVDVHFNKKTSSLPLDGTKSTNGSQPSTQANGSFRNVVSNGGSENGDWSNRPSNHASCGDVNDSGTLSTIPEEPSATCTDPEVICLPKCQKFPSEQANPADVVPDKDNSAAMVETVFDGDDEMHEYIRSNSDGSTSMPSLPWSTAISSSSVTSVSSRASKDDQLKHNILTGGLTNLASLDCLLHEHSLQALEASIGKVETTNALDKARQSLHSAIQNLVHKIPLAHQAPSDTEAEESATAMRDLKLNGESKYKGVRLVHTPLVARPLGCTKLPKRRQLELWRHFIDHIAPCLDVLSNKRYFQHTIPILAKSANHLHYAVLALSARHLENHEAFSSHAESQGLQQDAINLLLQDVHTRDTATVATCIILCIMDLCTLPPSQCQSSLITCAALMETADVNARSGGLRQALFWCFANLAVWHSLSHPEQPPALTMQSFYPSESLAETVNYIRSLTLGDGYAKYAVFLASTIVGIHFHTNSAAELKQVQSQAQHSALTDLLSDWFNCRSEDMQPLMSYPSILDDEHHPFPMLLYPTAPATIGNLLYHCASMLLLESATENSSTASTTNECNEANESSKPQQSNGTTNGSAHEIPAGKGITWHARQVCGMLSESHEPAVLIHGRHALDIAARVISHGSEKDAILALLERIERSTGWSTIR